MRDSLTVLAVLLILLLTAALVGPYFVDWRAQRELIEVRLTQAIGEPAHIGGAIELRLLPTPYLSLENVELADETAPIRLAVAKLRIEIAIAPLLRGEIDFIEALFEAPRLDLTLAADGSFPIPRQPPALAANMRFERIAIEKGTLAIQDPARRRSLVLEEIALDAEAASVSGPFKGSGALKIAGERNAFRFSANASEESRLKLKLIVDASARRPRADLDGVLSLVGGEGHFLSPSFSGAAKFQDLPDPPWRLSGWLNVDSRKAGLANLDLRIGDEDRPLSATGEAELDWSAAPKARARLRSSPIDLDRWFAANGGAPTPASFLAGLQSALAAAPPWPLELSYGAENLRLGGETFKDLSTNLVLGAGQAAWLRFEAQGPGQSRLSFDGGVQMQPLPGFEGRIAARAADWRGLRDWFAVMAPQLAPALKGLPFRAIDAAAQAHVSPTGIRIANLDMMLDGSTVSGTAEYAPATPDLPSRLAAELVAASLDLSGLPASLPDLQGPVTGMDLSLRFGAKALTLGRIGQGKSDLGALDVKLVKQGARIELEEFTWEGLDGAVVTASGALSKQAAHIDAKVEAARPGGLIDLVGFLAPSPATAFLRSRAAALSPADVTVTADAVFAGGHVDLTALTLEGKGGGTQISATARPDPTHPGHMQIAAALDAKESPALLLLLGAPSASDSGLGPGHIDISAHGPAGEMLEARIKALLAGTAFDFQGQMNADLARPSIAGELHLFTKDASPLLRAAGLALPDFSTKLPTDFSAALIWSKDRLEAQNIKGGIANGRLAGSLAYGKTSGGDKMLTGDIAIEKTSMTTLFALLLGPPQPARVAEAWSSLKFASPDFDLPASALALTLRSLELPSGLSARPARLTLEAAPGRLALRDLQLKFGEGAAKGEVDLRREGATVALQARLALDDIAFDLPGGRGRISASLDIAGTGQSADALMAGLAGSGHAAIADLTAPSCDPSAPARVFSAIEQDHIPIGADAAALALAREFQRAPLALGTLDFDISAASGVVRLSPTPKGGAGAKPFAPEQPVTTTVSAALNLRDATLEEHLVFTLNRPAKDWDGRAPSITLKLKGPWSKPVREIDAASFANALAARAILRESARIEAFEFDVRERAFFHQRLLSERRRAQERIKMEEAAGIAGSAN
ncbi:AsmA family protein [Methylocapsa aurea]|uniref:AsmA family protein n=1 Tax=Methylocapsa aurea TaxID=663610 RepID=UPI0005613259|nr:AsmA family protein [Methylocapsa aurea]